MSSSFNKFGKTLSDQFPVLYQHRYCDQEEFSIGVFSNYNYSGDESNHKRFLINNFETKTYLPTLSIPIYDCKAIASSSTVYLADEPKGNKLFVVKH